MPVKKRPARRVDTPPPSFIEDAELMADWETPLDPEKWERWTSPRAKPRPWPYRDGAVKVLERGLACPALGFDPDAAVAARAAARLAEEADRHADSFLHGAIGSGTGIPADPAALAAWRSDRAEPYRAAAEFWRDRLTEIGVEVEQSE